MVINEILMNDTRNRIRIKQLIIHEIVEILELYPQYDIAQHITYLADRKGFYRFTDDQVLKEIQRYKNKLEDEILEGEEEYYETELN
jgi:hypothetical protein